MHDPWKNTPRPTVLDNRDPTYARPEPWFVGSGRGLMILVLLTCAILVVLRGVQIVYAAESAWTWWHTRPAPVTVPPPPIARVSPREVRFADRSVNAASWFGPDDYPMASLRAEEVGDTRFEARFSRDGRPKSCRIVSSSKHAALDKATCDVVMRRGRRRAVSIREPEPVLRTTVKWRMPAS